jgi:hypothetical protein
LKRKKDKLKLAIKGYVSPHQRLMIKTILTHIDFLTEQIVMLDQEVAQSYKEVKKATCLLVKMQSGLSRTL